MKENWLAVSTPSASTDIFSALPRATMMRTMAAPWPSWKASQMKEWSILRSEGKLAGRFNAFGQHRHLQRLAEGDDDAHDGRAVALVESVPDEGVVDLELIQRQPVQIRQRRIAGAEIVEREADADLLEALHFFDGALDIL